MRTAMIESYLRQLTRSLGEVRTPIGGEDLHKLFIAKNYAGMVGLMKRSMSIECRITLGLVNSGGPVGAPAWVQLYDPMPMAGTEAFKTSAVKLFLRKTFVAEASFEAMVAGIAHELAHIVLESINHPLRKEEEAVDLTAMLMGYRDFLVTGCVHYYEDTATEQNGLLLGFEKIFSSLFSSRSSESSESRGFMLGYLSREEVHYAARFMTLGK